MNAVMATGRGGLQPGRKRITATGPNAANRSDARQARNDVMAPPSDMPVAYTRFASMQSVASTRSSSAPTIATSSCNRPSPVRLKCRPASPWPSGATITKSSRSASGLKLP